MRNRLSAWRHPLGNATNKSWLFTKATTYAPHKMPTSSSLASRCNRFFPSTINALYKDSLIKSSYPIGSRSVISWAREKLEKRENDKKAAKTVEKITLMANTPTWTLKMFADEIDESLSSWRTKIPGVSGSTEVKAAKEMQKVVKAMLEHLGDDATAQDVADMDRKAKLKLCIACELPLDNVNMILQQFRHSELLHRILRYRKENGIPLPTDDEGLKMAMQQDGMKVLTNQEKRELREAYEKMQK